MKKLISIVITAYNEEDSLPRLLHELTQSIKSLLNYQFEFIVVENGSIDNTMLTLSRLRKKYPNLKIIQLSKNVGWDEGIVAGLSYSTGDAAIIMVADLQDDPTLISQFIKEWENGAEIVFTILRKRINNRRTIQLGTEIFNRSMSLLTEKTLPDNASEFGLYDRKVYSVLSSLPEHNKFFRGLTHLIGFKKVAIERDRSDRVFGESKATLLSATQFALNGLFGFSNILLRLPYIFFIILILFAIISAIYYTIQFAAILAILSMLFLSFGIQGEYIIRILNESRNRPSHIVSNTYGFNKNDYEK